MCIYCGTSNYRKIYKNHHGDIPKDDTGRKFDIHHIDGNHDNNDPKNLIALSINDHYSVHYKQGDFVACYLIARKLKLSKEELSRLLSLANKQRVADGRHNFQKRGDGTSVASDSVKNGTNRLVGKGLSHPKVDKKVYCFQNKISGEIVNMTQYEFVRKFNIHQPNISRLIRGKQKSAKKWILINL